MRQYPGMVGGRALQRPVRYVPGMCRDSRILFKFDPPATEDEVRAAALHDVRMVRASTQGLTGELTFTTAYVAIAWLCRVPNLAVGGRISNQPAAA